MKERELSLADLENPNVKLTQVHVTLDTAKMREKGMLRRREDYSDEAFFSLMETRMRESNSDLTTFTCNAYAAKSKGKRRKVGINIGRVCSVEGDKFLYAYIGVWGYLGLFFRGWKRVEALWYYHTNEKAKEQIQRYIRELLWRNYPVCM
jgi:hypothetical protein